MKHIAIVGGGIGALCAGIRLLHEGFTVSIYEKEASAGGAAKTLRLGDSYLCDNFASIPIHPNEYAKIFQDVELEPKSFYTLIPLTDIYKIYTNDNRNYCLSKNYALEPEKFEQFFQENPLHYGFFVQDYFQKYCLLNNQYLREPFLTKRSFFGLATTKNARYFHPFQKADQAVKRFIESPVLRQFLLFQIHYMGSSPYDLPAMYATIPASVQALGLHQIAGGIGGYVNALIRAFLKLGGKLECNAQVSQILIQDNTAYGVLVNGFKQYADIILVDTDFTYTIKNLLPNTRIPRKYKTNKLVSNLSCSVFMLRLVVTGKLSMLKSHNIYLSSSFEEEMLRLSKGYLPKNPPIYVYYPAAVDDSFFKNGCTSLNMMIRVPNLSHTEITWDEKAIFTLRKFCLKALEEMTRIHPIENRIENEYYSTPIDLLQTLSYSNGAAFGLKHTLSKSLCFRPQCKIKSLQNLYFTGASTHPGTGVSLVMKSAEIVSNEIIKDLNE